MRRLTAEKFHEKLARIIQQTKKYHPQRVILFGSSARGDYDGLSDDDLLIAKETDRPFLACTGDVSSSCDYDIPLQSLVYTPQEFEQMRKEGNSCVETVLREEVVVYEQQ